MNKRNRPQNTKNAIETCTFIVFKTKELKKLTELSHLKRRLLLNKKQCPWKYNSFSLFTSFNLIMPQWSLWNLKTASHRQTQKFQYFTFSTKQTNAKNFKSSWINFRCTDIFHHYHQIWDFQILNSSLSWIKFQDFQLRSSKEINKLKWQNTSNMLLLILKHFGEENIFIVDNCIFKICFFCSFVC